MRGQGHDLELRARITPPDAQQPVKLYRLGLSYVNPENDCVMSSGLNSMTTVESAKPTR